MEYTFYAFDTDCVVHIHEDHDAQKLEQLFNEIVVWHDVFNVFDPKSEVSRFNQASGDFVASPLFYKLAREMMHYRKETDHLFEPFIEMVEQQYRLGKSINEVEKKDYIKAHTKGEIEFLENGLIRKSMPEIAINFHSFLKGYACDYMREYMYEALDLRHFLIDFGGNVIAEGMAQEGDYWYVGIQSVTGKESEMTEVVKLLDESLVTSANYERPVQIESQYYSHMLHPKNGEYMPYMEKSVSIKHAKSVVAEVLSTVLFVSEEENFTSLLKPFRARAIVQNGNQTIDY